MTNIKASLSAALFLGFAAFGGAAFAADQAQTQFLQTMHAINRTEIDAGKMAQSRGQTQAVKDYGKVLEDDHKMLDKRVEGLAKNAKIDIEPKNFLPAVQEQEKKLGAMTNELKNVDKNKFDGMFAAKMADGHKEAIAMVQKAEQTFKDNKFFEDLAKGTLPILQKHEDMATKIHQESRTMGH